MQDFKFPVARQKTMRAFSAVKAFHDDDFTIRKTAHGEIRFMLLVWQGKWNPQTANAEAEKARKKNKTEDSGLEQLSLF